MTAAFSIPSVLRAVQEVCQVLVGSPRGAFRWQSLSEDALWRELVACMLGSRVRFEIAGAALERLVSADLLSSKRRTSRFEEYEHDVLRILASTGDPWSALPRVRYPFPRVRAGYIRRAAERIYGRGETIRGLLAAAGDVRDARRLLTTDVPGLGPKQASLFLRNTGYATHVAVLDVHVLTYMNWLGLTTVWTRVVPRLRTYELLEDVFVEHSFSHGHPPDRFDLAVWVVIRVAKKMGLQWRS